MPKHRSNGRGDVLRTAIRLVLTLRRGRWTMFELADELGILWRTAYRLVKDLEAVGVTVERSREKEHVGRGGGAVYYRIPAGPLKKLLKL